MSDAPQSRPAPQPENPPVVPPGGNWKPVLVLLLLSPSVGELLSGSSPPLQFFNPIALTLLVCLYGCGALLVRETVARQGLNGTGLLLLGAAYGIVEEGLTCKSFFNPNWTDTGFLSVYGRAGGVNWVWTIGLTVYHMVVSITVPIFLTEALFPAMAQGAWLRRRGYRIAGAALAFVTILGFVGFDNWQFHLTEIKQPLALAHRWINRGNPLDRFIADQLKPKSSDIIRKAAESESDSPDLRHVLQDELNRLLPRADLYSPERFAAVALDEALKRQTTNPPHGDKLVILNRKLLEAAFSPAVATRGVYPFRPSALLTLCTLVTIAALVLLAVRQRGPADPGMFAQRPWRAGLIITAMFVVVGFVLPGLVEHGAKIPAFLDCLLWCGVILVTARSVSRVGATQDRVCRRGLWAIGVITPWVLFALLLGIFVGMSGAKSFSGMALVALLAGIGILVLALRCRRRLGRSDPLPLVGDKLAAR